MKRIKSILTVLMAAVFAMSLVPAGAWAVTESANTGHFGTSEKNATFGKISINNAEDDETYSLYKILDLASFDDDNKASTAAGHAGDAYSYVIKSDSPWLEFIQGYQAPTGTHAFKVDTSNPVTFVEDGKAAGEQYYIVQVKDNFFGDPASNANYDEDQTSEYMADDAKVQAFAKKALEFATKTGDYASHTYAVNQPTADATSATPTDGTVEWDDLHLGWYLVGSTLGRLVALDTTNNQVTMKEKNERPTIDKKVMDSDYNPTRAENTLAPYSVADGTLWVENTDHKIGDTARFRTRVTVKKNGTGYVLHDVMEEGLTLVPESIKVYARVADQNISAYASTPFTTVAESADTFDISTPSGVATRLTDKCSFEIAFADAFIDSLKFDETESRFESVIEVEYSAILNDKAVVIGDTEAGSETPASTAIGHTDAGAVAPTASEVDELDDVDHSRLDGRNTNQTILTFGADSSTVWDTATVETYQFDVVKTKDSDTTAFDLLAGAKFKLYKYDTTTSAKVGDAIELVLDPSTSNTYRTPLNNSETAVDEFTTAADKVLKFKGLQPGDYLLEETAAPNGYNKLSSPIIVHVDDKSGVSVDPNPIANPIASTIAVTYGGNYKDASAATTAATDASALSSVATAGGKTTYTTDDNGGVHVINQTGPELPSTGGIGTTIFYVAGTVLVVGAAVMLVAKRRMGAEA